LSFLHQNALLKLQYYYLPKFGGKTLTTMQNRTTQVYVHSKKNEKQVKTHTVT